MKPDEFQNKASSRLSEVLLDLNPETKEMLKPGIKSLETDPFISRSHADIKKFKGTGKREDIYLLRIGSYRIIYTVEGNPFFP